MFKIRANHTETFEVRAGLDAVKDFFTDIENFTDLMPNLENLHIDSKGIMHWEIRTAIPFVGTFTEKFSLEESENSDERIEWIPEEREKNNLMRYAAEFLPKGSNKTLVRFSQFIELRRKSASDLHLLAGFAGERVISSELTKGIAKTLRTFADRAQERLEN